MTKQTKPKNVTATHHETTGLSPSRRATFSGHIDKFERVGGLPRPLFSETCDDPDGPMIAFYNLPPRLENDL